MKLKDLHKKISLAAVAGGIFYLLSDPSILALIPAPWGLIIGKFVAGVTVGGVAYNMQPPKREE